MSFSIIPENKNQMLMTHDCNPLPHAMTTESIEQDMNNDRHELRNALPIRSRIKVSETAAML